MKCVRCGVELEWGRRRVCWRCGYMYAVSSDGIISYKAEHEVWKTDIWVDVPESCLMVWGDL